MDFNSNNSVEESALENYHVCRIVVLEKLPAVCLPAQKKVKNEFEKKKTGKDVFWC